MEGGGENSLGKRGGGFKLVTAEVLQIWPWTLTSKAKDFKTKRD